MRRVYVTCIWGLALFVCTGTSSPYQRRSRLQSNKDALITTVRLSPHANTLSVGRADGSVTLWDVMNGQWIWTSQGDWRLTRRIGVGPGDRYSDSIVDLTAPGS